MKFLSRHIKYVVTLLISITIISCYPTRRIAIDIPVTTSGVLPDHIQSLVIITGESDSRFTDLESDSLQKIFYKRNFKLDTLIYDVQMADTTLKALGELLFESGRYDYIIPENRFISTGRTTSTKSQIPWNQISNLCETFKADAVLSLDYIKMRVVTDFSYESYFDAYQVAFIRGTLAKMAISYEALFRVYDPLSKKLVFNDHFRDTLYWENFSRGVALEQFTPVKQGLTEAGIDIALKLSDRIAIKWRTEGRDLYLRGNADLRKASLMAMEGDWNSALERWEKAVEQSRSPSVRSKAQYNIALTHEIMGDIDQALIWAMRSYETMYRPLTYDYLITLKRRIKEIEDAK